MNTKKTKITKEELKKIAAGKDSSPQFAENTSNKAELDFRLNPTHMIK